LERLRNPNLDPEFRAALQAGVDRLNSFRNLPKPLGPQQNQRSPQNRPPPSHRPSGQ
jgi:hypothetical protein